MIRTFALLLALFISTASSAFQPRIGLWSNSNETGTGYTIDIQNGVLVLAIYSYQVGGPA